LSNIPVGIARAIVDSELITPRRNGSRAYCARAGPPPELGERGAQEDLGLERRLGAVVDEQPVHLRRRDAVGQRGRDEASRRDADVGVEVVEIEAVERIRQREQRADFVDAAQRPAAGEGEPDARTGTPRAGASRARIRLARHVPPGGRPARRAAAAHPDRRGRPSVPGV
jgi:hypothetical protein